jgi:hypothetical protein
MKQTLALAPLLAAAAIVHAAEGVIEINHAKVMAAGGYPYVIDQPGSYRLTSNLSQPDADTDVIRIWTDNVTLDLNGFAMTGANECVFVSGPPASVNCSGNGNGFGVHANGLHISVRNGSITGMGNGCLWVLGQRSQVDDLSVGHCGGIGIQIGIGTVSRVASANNRADGIQAFEGSVADSVARGNGGVGVVLSGTVKNTVAVENAQAGIAMYLGVVAGSYATGNAGYGIDINSGTVTASSMVGNNGEGLRASGAVTYSGNALSGNNGGGAQTYSSGFLLNGGGNVCGSAACP